jgi:hypothetical protein
MSTRREHEVEPQYPVDYKQVFADNYQPIDQLPVLNLEGRQGHTDYIDFIRTSEMTAPVMRYKDRFNRIGLALHLRCTYGEWKDKEVVLAPFQRYTGGNTWAFGWGRSQCFVEWAYQGARKEGIDCPYMGSNVPAEQLKNILTGKDPVVELVQH